MEDPVSSSCGRRYQLLLVRHGKAAPKNAGLSDFERILTPKGQEESKRTAVATKARVSSIDLMLSSPADRALETAHIFARIYKYSVHKIRIAETVYSAESIQPLLACIRNLDNTERTVAIFGHNPLFDELASYFISGFMRTIPKSAVLGIELQADSWTGISGGKGHLLFFLTP